MGTVYGATATFGDVLDLGCGTGAQLERIAPQMQGRLVGVDISAESCNRAHERIRAAGNRSQILQADLLDLQPEELGRFDLIYCVGVIFVVPLAVRRQIVRLLAACMKPGGVAVLGYYAGSLDTLRANLHQTLRSTIPEGLERGAAIAYARKHLCQMQMMASDSGRESELLRVALHQTQELPDTIFFHEVLNQCFVSIQTTEIERSLASHGIGFASYLGATPFSGLDSSASRAIAADTHDYFNSSYRHAVFVRWTDENQSPDVRRDGIRWHSLLREIPTTRVDPQATVFQTPDHRSITVRGPVTSSMLRSLQNGPMTWREAYTQALRAAVAEGLRCAPDQEEISSSGFSGLWFHNYIYPSLQ